MFEPKRAHFPQLCCRISEQIKDRQYSLRWRFPDSSAARGFNVFLEIPYRTGLAEFAVNGRVGAMHALFTHVNSMFQA
jgi:hypothetical protein